MWSAPLPPSLRRRKPASRLADSFGNSICHEPVQDHVQVFLARYKLVVCMNFFVLFSLCICSGFFSSNSSGSEMGNYKGPDGNSKSYQSYMDYQTKTTTMRSSSSSPPAAGGRLRGLSRGDKGKTLRKASGLHAHSSSSSPGALSTHVPQSPPRRFVPGTLPQSEDKPVMIATSAAAPPPAETANMSTMSTTASKTGASNGSSKRKALLSNLVSSTKPNADMLMTMAADEREDTPAASASAAAADALEDPLDTDSMSIYTGGATAPVHGTFSEVVGGEKAMPSIHADLGLDVEVGSDQNVRAALTNAEEKREITGSLNTLKEANGINVDHSVTSLCPLTPPWPEAHEEPAVEVEEVGVSLNPQVTDAEHAGHAALAMEATEVEVKGEPSQQMEDMVAMPLLHDRRHPLEFIPPFVRDDFFCMST